MILDKIGYSYKDLTIVPTNISLVKSRSEIEITDKFRHLPLFTAPMSSVVNEKNWSLFEKEGIYSIIPRNISIDFRLNHCKKAWSAFSLQEIKDYFIEKDFDRENCQIKLLIDVANGHMKQLYDLTEELHKKYGSNGCLVMIGNIANPETLIECAIHGVDYVRCGVGGGFGCLTTSNVGVHFPMGSLIDEIYTIKKKIIQENKVKAPYIVADGGVRNYSDIIKALALGADYVMCGSIFCKMYESAATLIVDKTNEKLFNAWLEIDDEEEAKNFICKNLFGYKKFYGMSTKKAQVEINHNQMNLKTSEGVEKKVSCEYTMNGWVDNFQSYLRSAMSYCNSFNLQEFIGKQILIPISVGTKETVNE